VRESWGHPIKARVGDNGRVLEYVDEERPVAACPWHGMEVDLETGASLANPAWRVRVYDTDVREGVIYVDM
jgi:nitrite reductase/ring-hydroxylating ferredoxin subunit